MEASDQNLTGKKPELMAVGCLLALGAGMTCASLLRVEPVALPLALITPGLSIVIAAVDWRGLASIPLLIGLAAIVSVAFFVLVSLGLDLIDVSLSRSAFLIAADGVLVLCCLVVLIGRGAAVSSDTYVWRRPQGWMVPTVSTLLAALIVVGATQLPGRDPDPFAALYLSGATPGKPIPTEGTSATFEVTVVNGADEPRAFTVSPVVDGQPWQAQRVDLEADASTRLTLSGPTPSTRCLTRAVVHLADGSDGQQFTDLTVWLSNSTREPGASQPSDCHPPA